MTEERLRELLAPYVSSLDAPGFGTPADLYSRLGVYLELLLRWNARTNLTAIREPEEIVSRHFGESLFAAVHLRPYVAPVGTLLDVGSGAGFPGLPTQLCYPDITVTLAESQGKKAAFLREVARALGVATEVWAARVESMPLERSFDVVTLRAVDKMDAARSVARSRLAAGGVLAELTVASDVAGEPGGDVRTYPVPGSANRVLRIERVSGD